MAKTLILALLVAFSLTNFALADDLQEYFGYIDVRAGAHMFYVLYENDHPGQGNWTDYPLIMWLQGGPGSSGVGYGNFWELGPYYINGTLRPGRWTQKANLLFVDNPVGSGYSYVDDLSFLTTTNEQIAADLVEFTKQLYDSIPDLEVMPFYVYAESYGGKMTVDYALALQQAIDAGEIVCDLQGVALGDSWISPMDSVNTWGSFLYGVAYVNEQEQAIIDAQAAVTQAAVDAELWHNATDEWGETERVVFTQTGGISFYNVFRTTEVYSRTTDHNKNLDHMSPNLRLLYENHVLPFESVNELEDYMNGPQADAWDIPDNVTWGGQSDYTFSAQAGDFMKPVIDSVVSLLETTNIHVSVFTGDWDLICDTPGTYNWIEAMDWTDKAAFEATGRVNMYVSSYSPQAGYYQRYEQFSLFTFLRSGHMVPIDSPEMCLDMIDLISQWSTETTAREKAELAKKAQELKREAEEKKKAKIAEELKREMEEKKKAKLKNEMEENKKEKIKPNVEEKKKAKVEEDRKAKKAELEEEIEEKQKSKMAEEFKRELEEAKKAKMAEELRNKAEEKKMEQLNEKLEEEVEELKTKLEDYKKKEEVEMKKANVAKDVAGRKRRPHHVHQHHDEKVYRNHL